MLVALLLGGAALPLLLQAGEPVLAWRGGEVWGHLWTWWWHGASLPAWPAGTNLAMGADPWPAIDPLPALLGALACRALGITTAWNLVALAAIGGAFAGGWWLARRAGGEGLVGGLTLAMAPIFLGSLLSGLSEDLAIGVLAVAVGLVVIPEPSGAAPSPPWRWVVTTGGTIGLLAWCGPYLAWMGAMTATVAGVVHLARRPGRWPRWLIAAALALALALPPLLSHGDRAITGIGHHAGTPTVQFEPLWRVNPWGAADLASFAAPGPAHLPKDAVVRLHPTYLGLAVLALALAGGRSRWWWLLAVSLLLAPGEQPAWLGQPLGVTNPFAASLDWLPGGARLNHHARLFLLGQLGLVVLAARGAARLGTRLGRPALVAAAACLLVCMDYGLLAPVPWPLPTADAEAPDFLAETEDLSPGVLLWIPLGGPGLSPQRPLLDQRAHGRVLALDPNRPGPPPRMPRSPLGRWLASLGRDPGALLPDNRSVTPLLDEGWTVLAVAAPLHQRVAEALGPPDIEGEDGAAWDLVRTEQAHAAPRPAPLDADMLIEERTP